MLTLAHANVNGLMGKVDVINPSLKNRTLTVLSLWFSTGTKTPVLNTHSPQTIKYANHIINTTMIQLINAIIAAIYIPAIAATIYQLATPSSNPAATTAAASAKRSLAETAIELFFGSNKKVRQSKDPTPPSAGRSSD